ncbi:MAG: ATP-dependent Clp protease ATP-binding subunit [Candidatus Peribacteria bacterium]|nr:MAG: ATP-dependent Clp protease ATP-binding subunit [Candidatus Peribacteria bacterium]
MYMYTKNFEFTELFWSFIGLKDTSVFQEYIDNSFRTMKKSSFESSLERFQLTGAFKEQFSAFKEQGMTKLNFLALLTIALDTISNKFRTVLMEEGVDVAYMKERVNKVIQMTHKVDLSPIEFFKMLNNMVTQLGLDISKVEMFVDMNKLMEGEISEDMLLSANPDIIGDTDDLDLEDISGSDDDKKLTIEYFGTDLTEEAKNGFLDPVIGRSKEIEQIIYTLLRKTKNNPLLIGEAGVGKTAIVE